MACMEHSCSGCGREWFDNKTWAACPTCGSFDVSNWFDEPQEDAAGFYPGERIGYAPGLDYSERDFQEITNDDQEEYNDDF